MRFNFHISQEEHQYSQRLEIFYFILYQDSIPEQHDSEDEEWLPSIEELKEFLPYTSRDCKVSEEM